MGCVVVAGRRRVRVVVVCASPNVGWCTSWSASGGAVVGDPAVAHHHGPVDERRQRARARGRPARSSRRAALSWPQGVGERLLVGQVDAGGRLVEEEQLGLAGQGPGDQHPLLLAAGQRARRRRGPGRRGRRPSSASSIAARSARRERPQQPAPGRAGRRRRPPRPRRARRTSALARCGTKPIRCQSRERRRAGCRTARPSPRSAGAARSARGPAWTCRSRWRPSARRTRPASTVRSMPRRTGRPPMATAPSRDARRPGRSRRQQPFASRSAARFCAHQRQVVLVGGLVAQALDRVEHGASSSPRSSARVSASLRAASVSENTVVMPSSRIRSWSRARSAGVGSASGERPAIGSRSQAVPREVAERVVADHDGVALAVGQPVGVLRVERLQVGAQRRRRWRRTRRAWSGSTSPELVGDRVAERRPSAAGRARSAGRGRRGRGPRRLARSSCSCPSSDGLEVDDVGGVEHVALGVLLDASSTAGWKPCS